LGKAQGFPLRPGITGAEKTGMGRMTVNLCRCLVIGTPWGG